MPGRAIRLASVSGALAALAGPVAGGYAQRKEAAGLLDYDDLIDRTRTLLFDPGAAWVLYKLDGGLDHLLLDEVQDTAPQQWRIAHALTEEFFAGSGSRDPPARSSRWATASSRSIRSRAPTQPSLIALTTNCPSRVERRAMFKDVGWTCRSAPPLRC